jgi:hypothetical protein
LKATQAFRVALAVEEKFDLVLGNYVEYEMELVDLALNESIFRNLDWSSFRIDTQRVVRRVVNLLTSTRLYVDHVQHGLGRESSSAVASINLKVILSEQYDRRLGYRAMEAMRNVVQHESTAFLGLLYATDRVECTSQLQRHRAEPVVDMAALRMTKFKLRVLNELDSLGPKVRVAMLVRDYVEGLAVVHETIRAQSAATLAASELVIRAAVERGRKLLGDDPVGLCMVAREPDRTAQPVYVNTHLVDQLEVLVRKNRDLSTLSKRFVSSEAS